MVASGSSRAARVRHVEAARQLRAETIAAFLSAAGRAAARAPGRLRARLARWQERRRTYDALMRCSDRVLADIGIERAQIPEIARAIDPSRSAAVPASRRLAAARARLAAAREARREQRRVYRELMAYQDRELDELGVRRADIRRIARGAPVLRDAA
jgi:uncharacterized protein YjiS (DUF1127 family)